MNLLLKKYFPKYQKKLEVNFEVALKPLRKKSSVDHTQYLIEASAVYSSNIEGNPMDLNSFMNTKLLKEKSKPKAFIEIVDLIETYNFAQKKKLNQKNFLTTHKKLSQSFLITSKRGKYRDDKVGVFGSQGLIYLAIESEKITPVMNQLFDEIEILLHEDLSVEQVFYFASMIHLKFVHIHPFADGNGRSARLLEKWFLAEKIGEVAWRIESEKHYKENQQTYYQNINLGVNYYELNYNHCLDFLLMLPNALK